jgi:hypothetical protein
MPRSTMKTTVCTIAHSIQWVLYWPNVRILISTATGTLGSAIMVELKGHFTSNQMLRELFPELCPKQQKNGKIEDFGNMEQFTVPGRWTPTVKEPTVKIATVETKIQGYHVDVAKNDDLVERENVRTPQQIELVKGYRSFLDPIVDYYQTNKIKPEVVAKWGNHGWIDDAGTRYDFSDLWGHLLDVEESSKSAYLKATSSMDGYKPTRNVVQMSALAQRSERQREGRGGAMGRAITAPVLAKMELEDPEMTFSQYYMNPIPSSSGLVDDSKQIIFIPRRR